MKPGRDRSNPPRSTTTVWPTDTMLMSDARTSTVLIPAHEPRPGSVAAPYTNAITSAITEAADSVAAAGGPAQAGLSARRFQVWS